MALAVSMERTTSARRSLDEGTIVTRVSMAKVTALTFASATRVKGWHLRLANNATALCLRSATMTEAPDQPASVESVHTAAIEAPCYAA